MIFSTLRPTIPLISILIGRCKTVAIWAKQADIVYGTVGMIAVNMIKFYRQRAAFEIPSAQRVHTNRTMQINKIPLERSVGRSTRVSAEMPSMFLLAQQRTVFLDGTEVRNIRAFARQTSHVVRRFLGVRLRSRLEIVLFEPVTYRSNAFSR